MVLPPDDAPAEGVIKPTRVRHGQGVFQTGEFGTMHHVTSGTDRFCQSQVAGITQMVCL